MKQAVFQRTGGGPSIKTRSPWLRDAGIVSRAGRWSRHGSCSSVARSQGGLGLGLAIVRSLVQLHGGRVWATSPGHGQDSEFILELPGATEAPADPAAPGTGRLAPPIAPGGTARVLIVDDNDDLATLLADMLASIGYVVRTAADGLAALRVSHEFEPDVVLLDNGLPVLDGYEVARQLRASPRGASMRLVAVTGYGQESDRQCTAEVGFDAHLVKPVDIDHLHAVLERLRAAGGESGL